MMVIMRAIGIMRVRSMRERGREQEREWGCWRGKSPLRIEAIPTSPTGV